MIARPYQEQAIKGIWDEFDRVKSTLVVLPTGCGKTVTFAEAAHRWPLGRVLMIAHREELIYQMARTVKRITGEDPAIEMADHQSDENGLYTKAKVVVGSVQTLCRPKRHLKFDPTEFGLLVVDEAHHDVPTCSTYRMIRDHFGQNSELRILGVTATPDRTDGLALGQSFDSVAFEMDLPTAIEQGWLVPIMQRYAMVESLNFERIKERKKGDFSDKEVESVYDEPQTCHEVAATVHQIAQGKKSLIFMPGVESARKVASILNRIEAITAASLVGDDESTKRTHVLREYKHGSIQYLVGCAIFTEGFDEPSIEYVFNGRPTKSRSLYTQMVGRGTRTLEGVLTPDLNGATNEERRQRIAESPKPCVYVVDLVGVSQKLKLVTTADLLGGRYTDEVRKRATKAAEESAGDVDISEELKRAKAELDREKAEEAARKELEDQRRRESKMTGMYAEVKLMQEYVDPFGYGQGGHARQTHDSKFTDRQRETLKRHGYDPDNLTYPEGKRIIGEIFASFGGAPTPKQIEALSKRGENDVKTKEKAEALFAILKAANWRTRDYQLTRDRLFIKKLESGLYAPAIRDPRVGDVVIEKAAVPTVDGAREFLTKVLEA
jgi:superfamily II DNA or RNA helicase